MSEPFNVDTPSPDDGHEAIRVAVVRAIEDLQFNAESVDVSFSLVDMLFQLVDQVLTEVAASTTDREQLRADHDALAVRVTALEALTAVPPPDDPPTAVPTA